MILLAEYVNLRTVPKAYHHGEAWCSIKVVVRALLFLLQIPRLTFRAGGYLELGVVVEHLLHELPHGGLGAVAPGDDLVQRDRDPLTLTLIDIQSDQ